MHAVEAVTQIPQGGNEEDRIAKQAEAHHKNAPRCGYRSPANDARPDCDRPDRRA
jgi:hypothetical protein